MSNDVIYGSAFVPAWNIGATTSTVALYQLNQSAGNTAPDEGGKAPAATFSGPYSWTTSGE